MNKILKIYFAHSMSDYHSTYEKKCINNIIQRFKTIEKEVEIINPADININNNLPFNVIEAKYFLPLIRECDELHAFKCEQKSNKCKDFNEARFTTGVIYEINYAKSIGKVVKEWN